MRCGKDATCENEKSYLYQKSFSIRFVSSEQAIGWIGAEVKIKRNFSKVKKKLHFYKMVNSIFNHIYQILGDDDESPIVKLIKVKIINKIKNEKKTKKKILVF